MTLREAQFIIATLVQVLPGQGAQVTVRSETDMPALITPLRGYRAGAGWLRVSLPEEHATASICLRHRGALPDNGVRRLIHRPHGWELLGTIPRTGPAAFSAPAQFQQCIENEARLHPYDEWLRKNWRPPQQRNHWPLIRTQPTPFDDLADAALARRLLRRLDSRSHISVGREVDQQAPSPARAVELLKICSIHFQSKTIDGNNIAIKTFSGEH